MEAKQIIHLFILLSLGAMALLFMAGMVRGDKKIFLFKFHSWQSGGKYPRFGVVGDCYGNKETETAIRARIILCPTKKYLGFKVDSFIVVYGSLFWGISVFFTFFFTIGNVIFTSIGGILNEDFSVPEWSSILSILLIGAFGGIFLLELKNEWRFLRNGTNEKAKIQRWETEEGSDGEALYNSIVRINSSGEEYLVNLEDKRLTKPFLGQEVRVLINEDFPNLVKRKFFLGIWRNSVVSGLLFLTYLLSILF